MAAGGMSVNNILSLLSNLAASNPEPYDTKAAGTGQSDFAALLSNLENLKTEPPFSSKDLSKAWQTLRQLMNGTEQSQGEKPVDPTNPNAAAGTINSSAAIQLLLSQLLLSMLGLECQPLPNSMPDTANPPATPMLPTSTGMNLMPTRATTKGVTIDLAWQPVSDEEAKVLGAQLGTPEVTNTNPETTASIVPAPNEKANRGEQVPVSARFLIPSLAMSDKGGITEDLSHYAGGSVLSENTLLQEKVIQNHEPTALPNPITAADHNSALSRAASSNPLAFSMNPQDANLEAVYFLKPITPTGETYHPAKNVKERKDGFPVVLPQVETEDILQNYSNGEEGSFHLKQDDSSSPKSFPPTDEKIPAGKAQSIDSTGSWASLLRELHTEASQDGTARESGPTLVPKTLEGLQPGKLFPARESGAGNSAVSGKNPEIPLAHIQKVVESVKWVQSGQVQEMTLQLKPEYLGRLQIRAGLENGQLMATIMVESPQVEQRLKENLSYLRESLGEMGFRIQKVEVIVVPPSSETNFLEWDSGGENHGQHTPKGKNIPSVEKSFSMETETLEESPQQPSSPVASSSNGRIDLRF